MKKTLLLAVSVLFITAGIMAQIPEGFVKGSVTLNDGSILKGYLKDKMKADVSISYVDENGANKKQFDGNQVTAVEINGIEYRCIKGDFFKLICNGKICFLQKASNTSGKAIYNGSEAIFVPGTEGKIGDYFVYINNELTRLTKKTVEKFINEQLSSSSTATEKAKSINGDIAALADAINIYNQQSK